MEEKKLVPKLRFPGFTEPWEQRKLGEISEISTGFPFDSQEFNDEGEYLVITNSNIQDDSPVVLNNIGNRINIDSGREKYILDKDDLLITMDGTVGRIAKVINDRLVLAQRVCRMKSGEPSFLYQLLSGTNFIQTMNKISHGGAIKHISLSEIAEYQCHYPQNKRERDYIGIVLGDIDNLITLHQRKLEHLKLKKKSLLQKLFPKEGEVYPEFRFPGFTDPWEQRKLGEIVKIERGGSPRPIDNYITTDADGLNWIKIGDAPEQGRYIVHAAEKIKSLGLSKTRQVEPGDLILSNSMSFGKPYIMGIHGCIHDGWLLIRNNQNIFDLKFLCNLLGTEQLHAQYRRLAAGSAVNNLNKELVSGTNVGVPSKAEQLKIGQFFESIDQYITLHQRKLEHLQLLKKALLQQLFV